MNITEMQIKAPKLLSLAMASHRAREEKIEHPTSTDHALGIIEYPDGRKYNMWVSVSPVEDD
jgi:hypothetical protein